MNVQIMESLTWGEMTDLLEVSGMTMDEIKATVRSGELTLAGKGMRLAMGLVWINERRVRPGMTFDEVANIPFVEIGDRLSSLGGPPDPTPPAPSGTGDASSSPEGRDRRRVRALPERHRQPRRRRTAVARGGADPQNSREGGR